MELHQIVQESVDEKYEYLPRAFGKNTKLLVEFFVAGKAGKAVVFATPEGDFLSPKAVENKVLSSQISLLEEELERKEKTRRDENFYLRDAVSIVEEDISYLQDQITKCRGLMK